MAAALLDRLLVRRRREAGLSSLNVTHEAHVEPDHRLLWVVISYAVGIACYFELPEEPRLWALLPVTCGVGAWVLRAHLKGTVARGAPFLLMLLAGMSVATLRTAWVEAPLLARAMSGSLSGKVLGVEASGSRGRLRLLVQPHSFQNRRTGVLPAEKLPHLVRLTSPAGENIHIGDRISGSVRLFPPSGAVRPGGYDFSFRAFYDGLGATGFSYGRLKVEPAQTLTFLLSARKWLSDTRQRLTERIRRYAGAGDKGELAAALLVGERNGISDEAEEALRQSGLAHILAISGLHMALVAGGTYAAMLALLAAFPFLALRVPIHRVAALGALVVALGYLVLSGASVATVRAFIMIALVFLGLLVGRRGLTMHSAAIAGLVILTIAPESLLEPGFQMSFAAVISLIAVYEKAREWFAGQSERVPFEELGLGRRLARKISIWVISLVVTALVAGTATGIIGLYHFGRLAPLGVVGNLLAMPLVSLVVMPAGVLGMVAMPFGLDAGPLAVMGLGLSGVLKAARFTAALGPDLSGVGTLSPHAALSFLTAFLTLLLLGGKRRLVLVPAFGLLGSVLVALYVPPDVYISDRGVTLAARDPDGGLRVAARRSGFAAENWLGAEGTRTDDFKKVRMKAPQWKCAETFCLVQAHAPRTSAREKTRVPVVPLTIATVTKIAGLEDACANADVVVSDLYTPRDCKARLVLDRRTRPVVGSVALWLDEREGRTAITRQRNGRSAPNRPWQRRVGED